MGRFSSRSFCCTKDDKKDFKDLDKNSRNHYGEMVAFDRSIGILRKKINELGISDNTIIWYCSDNGGLKNISPSTVGNLRGGKYNVGGGIKSSWNH